MGTGMPRRSSNTRQGLTICARIQDKGGVQWVLGAFFVNMLGVFTLATAITYKHTTKHATKDLGSMREYQSST